MIVYSVSTLSRTGCINIGYATETGVTQIGFDCSTWLERWPDMTVEVWVTAPGAASAYEAKTHRKGDVIVWEVMQSDTQTPGAGRVELIGYTADKRKLSASVNTRIDDSMLMAEGTEPPEAQQPWYTAAQEAKARAEALARHAPIIDDGMWMLWDPDKGEYVNSGVQAQAGSGLPEGAGPWMQVVTGADGVARWEPRLAYEDGETTTILSECTVTADDMSATSTPLAEPLIVGKQYAVTYNGVEYKTTAGLLDFGEGDPPLVAIGDIGMITGGTSTGEPFLFVEIPAEHVAETGYWMVQAMDGASDITIKIEFGDKTIKTIDPKYLPAGAGGGTAIVYIEKPDFSSSYELKCMCYEDAALTKQLDYATGSALLAKGARIVYVDTVGRVYNSPVMLATVTESMANVVMIFNPLKMSLWQVILLYTDSITGES